MSAAHTPGPWKTETLGHTIRVTEAVHESDNSDIAILGDCGSEKHQANARLIAAAPEMKDALQAAWSALHSVIIPLDKEERSQPIYRGCIRAREKVRLAIATATGGIK